MTPRAERLRETLAVLDVGHGNSAVLFSGDDVAVFDAGTGSGLLEFLRQQCVDHVKTVFLSHADQDHIGGLVGLLAAEIVTVERVVLNTDSSKESATWDDLLYELDARRRVGRIVFDTSITAGDSESFGAVTATAAAPSPYLSAKGPGGRDRSGRKITSNSISAVIRLATAAGPVALLTGDLDLVGLEDLKRADGDVTAPILVFPHHGGGTGSADVPGYVTRLIERVHPRVVVFSIGRRREGTPDLEIVRHLRQVAPEARIMCTQLSRFCAKSIPEFTATHLSPTFALGRRDRVCCGGAILVSLHDATEITPESDGHLAFIRNVAESPLCFGVEPPSRDSARRQDGTAAGGAGEAVVMDASRLCRNLQQEMGALFTCLEQDGRQRIRTPYLYPDGDCIDLFCKIEDGVVTVSDLAETTGWLRTQTAAPGRSPKHSTR